MKSLVVCCDGTWNRPDQKTRGQLTPTNVVKLSHAVAEKDAEGNPQEVYYHSGVGTDGSWWNQFWGGALGAGLDEIILSAYEWLCSHWEQGDRVFLFGFSRGAYTVRSLAGVLWHCGLVNLEGKSDAEKWATLSQVFQTGYRERKPLPSTVKFLPGAEPESSTLKITFLGVWDTVGSLGIPDDMGLLNMLDLGNYRFHDTRLGPQVVRARQALAMDEYRSSFAPVLWTKVPPQRDCQQIWFPGCHSDVGGGFAETGLSDGALAWMIDEAAGSGLVFRSNVTKQVKPNALDLLHDSVEGVWAVLRTQPRNVPRVDVDAPFHASAIERRDNPPLADGPFWPTKDPLTLGPVSVSVYAKPRWNRTGIYLEAGHTYVFSARGEWVDQSLKYDPAGNRRSTPRFGDLVHLVADLVGGLETAYKEVFKNKAADFWTTKRVESEPWFCLIGTIANQGDPAPDGTPDPMPIFAIGNKAEVEVTKSGYLWCFANDAWHFYENNKGSVTLTVQKK